MSRKTRYAELRRNLEERTYISKIDGDFPIILFVITDVNNNSYKITLNVGEDVDGISIMIDDQPSSGGGIEPNDSFVVDRVVEKILDEIARFTD